MIKELFIKNVKRFALFGLVLAFIAGLIVSSSPSAYALGWDANEMIQATTGSSGMSEKKISDIVSNFASNVNDEQDTDSSSDEENGLSTKEGRVSQLNVESHNPYHGMLRVSVFIGSEFATFGGTSKAHTKISEATEGYIIDVAPGGTIELPKVRARKGYYLVGWCTGGIPDYDDINSGKFWRADTKEITLEQNDPNTKNVTIYAVYATDNGDGYCTCGAWTAGAYSSNMDEIKATYADYTSVDVIQGVLFGILVLLGIAIIILIEKKG